MRLSRACFPLTTLFGACPSCDGLGVSAHFEEQLIVPDTDLSLRGGALAPWAKSTSKYYVQTLESLARHFGFSLDVAFRDLDSRAQHILLYGSGTETVQMIYDDGLRSLQDIQPFEGIIPQSDAPFCGNGIPTGCARSWNSSALSSLVMIVRANA